MQNDDNASVILLHIYHNILSDYYYDAITYKQQFNVVAT